VLINWAIADDSPERIIMIRNIVGFISKALVPTNTTAISAVRPTSVNPFANQSSNPFLSNSGSNINFYGKNQPVRGGYFAGYYNGKPNIVGKRLFLEV